MAALPGPKSAALRARRRLRLHRAELQHHRVPRPQYRDPLRLVDGWLIPSDCVDIDDVEISYTTNFGEGDPAPVDVNAQDLHATGIRGRDIGVAIIDTGYWKLDSLDKDSAGNGRVAAQYDACATPSTPPGPRSRPTRTATARTSPASSPAAAGTPPTASSASRPTRASFRSRPSPKTARAAMPR